jgi:hypothetical protein
MNQEKTPKIELVIDLRKAKKRMKKERNIRGLGNKVVGKKGKLFDCPMGVEQLCKAPAIAIGSTGLPANPAPGGL